MLDLMGLPIKKLVPFLIKNQIKQFDYVFISHPHRDHYEGLWAILKNNINININIKDVFFNIPDKEICDREIPWGCNYHDVLTFHKMLKHYDVHITLAEAGQSFDLGNDVSIDNLYAYDGVNTPVGKTDINDMSLIMMLKTDDYKFLFTGDLNRKLGSYLAENAEDIEANVLKVPHHGGEGLAPNSFFEKVNPEIAMIPGPKWIWCDKQRNRARHWFLDKKIPVYVNGFQGNITIIYKDGKLEVVTENKEEIRC